MVCIRLSIICSLVVGFILYGCENIESPMHKRYGDSLTIVTYHAPDEINPLTTVSGISALLIETIFDGLIKLEENLEIKPHLAASWKTSEDGIKWTFYLRQGVKFHDGIEFSAEDVEFTFNERTQSHPRNLFAGGLSDIQSIHVRDRYTLDIILKRPSVFFLYSMNVSILPAHILKGRRGRDNNFGRQPIGTGSFKFAHGSEKEIVLEANRDYFSGRPYLDRIIVRIYTNQEIAWARLMQEEGDFLFSVNPVEYDFLSQVSYLRVYRTPGLYYSMIAFNNDSELFKDSKVRGALNYAIDKDYIIRKILRGNGQLAAGTVWKGSSIYNNSIKPYLYDPQKAMALLKEAGWQDSDGDHILDKKGRRFVFTLLINEGDEIKGKIVMYIQQQLWELGILMDVKTISTASADVLLHGKFDAVYIDLFSHVYPDFNYNLWHSSQIDRGLNISRYRSDTIDRLLEQGRLAKDIESTRSIYYSFQQEIHDNPPGIFLYWADHLFALHQRFKGIRFAPVGKLAYINEWYVPEGEQKY